jgi:hypothetical protein
MPLRSRKRGSDGPIENNGGRRRRGRGNKKKTFRVSYIKFRV